MASRALQIIPPGARQVAPGVWQQRAHRRHGGAKHKKHHGPRRHQSLLAQRQIKYAAVLQFARALQAQQKINVPAWINFPALVLFLWGQNKHDKGAVSTAKAMQYDWLASSWGVSGMMQMGMSMALGSGGGAAFNFGGAPVPRQVQPQAAPAPAPQSGVQTIASADEINALANLAQSV